jgi:hypothetical protein
MNLDRHDRQPGGGSIPSVGHVTLTETGSFTGSQTTSIAGNLVEETVQGPSR